MRGSDAPCESPAGVEEKTRRALLLFIGLGRASFALPKAILSFG
jgi:hypothetical protein